MPLGLAPLLAALREAGLPVGVAEMARLQQVFALGPQLAQPEDRRLKAILRAVLVKSAEDRARFEPIFAAWLGRAGREVGFRELPPVPEAVPSKPARKPFVWRALAAAALPLLALMLGDRVRERPQPKPPPFVAGKPSQTSPTPIKVLTPAEIRQRTFTTWVPTLTVTPAEPVWKGWPAVTLGSLALLSACSLWITQRHRRWFPEPAPQPVRKGPPRVFLTPPPLTGPQLLEPREQEALVWGIGHFVADEPTRRLDLRATVRETARTGGVPHLLFQQARHPREVWLWIDEAADDPAIPRLAGEIEESLRAHRLPVERALFRGVPDWLVSSTGQAFAPNEVDERRDAALVAILTDGRILARHRAADDRKVKLDALLRGLSHWPRLAFVDFAAQPSDLASALSKHSLTRIAPPDLAAFLGSDDSAKRKTTAVAVTGDAVWAAACALAPSSIDELRAFQLRKRLKLATSPGALRDLRTEAPGPPGRLQWKPEARARRVNWLREAEAPSPDDDASESWLGQALDFWEGVYDRELQDREAAAGEGAWQDTPAHQHLTMERALLGLWRDAPNAIRELFRLHGGALREVIERHLGGMAPLDWGGPELVHFSWSWAVRSGAEQLMLQEMKLGGGMPAATLRRPDRLLLGLGICLGLAAGALGAAGYGGWRRPEGPPHIVHGPGKPAEAWQETRAGSGASWVVAVATRKSQAAQRAPAGAEVAVRWEPRKLKCVAESPTAEQWSCGTVANPPRFTEAMWRRVVVLAASPGTPGTDTFAIDLLDSGSADQVIVTTDWGPYVPDAGSGAPSSAATLVLPGSNWGSLRQAMRFEGTRPVHRVWPNLSLLAGYQSTLLRGLGACQAGETLEEDGMTFVRICPGTFTMGSAENDKQASSDEKPAHKVTLGEFWMGRTEVTNAQYRRPGPQELPVTSVTWDEARSFCERHGWRLPTEAEWEYAARADTQTPWFFGSDATRLREFAWFGPGLSGELHPVGTKKPNPWGLYDTYGNAWEWVTDWFGSYQAGPQQDPKGPVTGIGRSVRGGSFIFTPRILRSANRNWFLPSIRSRGIGFRCARSPSRQQP
jgi:formylglycine-generating enzyme required for sulfatase activity